MADGPPELLRDPFGPLGDVGSTVLVVTAVLVALMAAAEPLGWRPLRSTTTSLALLVVLALLAVAVHRWLRRGRSGAAPWPHLLLVAVPALLVAGYAVAVRVLPAGARDEWYLGGDHVRHLVMTAEEQATGVLSYGVESYPRAWHTVSALVWSAAGLRPQDSVLAVIDLSALLAWLLSAGVALTTAVLAASLGARTGLSGRAAAAAGLVAGSVTLWPSFQANYQALGLEASLVAGCVLAVVLRSQLLDPSGARGLVVAAAGWVAVAHTWQLLLPVVGLAALRSALGVARRHGRRGVAGGVLAAVAALAASWPALEAVVTRVGVQHATDADIVSPVPWLVLALGLVAGGVVAVRAGDRGVWWVVALAVLPAVTGIVLAAYVGITPDTYYPSKLLWHTAALSLAPLAVGAVAVAVRLQGASFRGSSSLRVVGGGTLALVLVYALLGPAGAFVGAWSTTDGATVLRLVSAPDAGRAQVVWSRGPVLTDTVARILLQAVRPDPTAPRTPQEPLTPDAECRLLAAASGPAVLSDQPAAAVRSRYACVPGLAVVEAAPAP